MHYLRKQILIPHPGKKKKKRLEIFHLLAWMMQCPWQPTWLLLPHFFAEFPAAGLLVSLSKAVHGVMKRLYETRPGATPKIRA